jgi:hypothetical protein
MVIGMVHASAPTQGAPLSLHQLQGQVLTFYPANVVICIAHLTRKYLHDRKRPLFPKTNSGRTIYK